MNLFHHHDIGSGMVEINFRYIKQWRGAEVVTQLAGIGSFTHQVQFIMDSLTVFLDDFYSPKPTEIS